MGRRKSKRRIRLRPRKRLPTVFQCPRCGVTAVSVEIRKKDGEVSVRCGSCGLGYVFEYEDILQPVDYYSKFVDKYAESLELYAG